MIRQPRASHSSAAFRSWSKSAFDRFTFLVCQMLQQGSQDCGCVIHNCKISASFLQSPKELFSYSDSHFRWCSCIGFSKSFRHTSKRTHPCSTKCTIAGSVLYGEHKPQKTRRFLLVGVISDLMSTAACVAMSESLLVPTHPESPVLPLRCACRSQFPTEILPPAGFGLPFVMLAFFGA